MFHHPLLRREGTSGKQQLTHMLGQFDAFHCDIQCGGVFDAGVLPPPLRHLDHFGLPLRPRWRTEELQAKFAADVECVVCADELKEPRKRQSVWKKKVFFLYP